MGLCSTPSFTRRPPGADSTTPRPPSLRSFTYRVLHEFLGPLSLNLPFLIAASFQCFSIFLLRVRNTLPLSLCRIITKSLIVKFLVVAGALNCICTTIVDTSSDKPSQLPTVRFWTGLPRKSTPYRRPYHQPSSPKARALQRPCAQRFDDQLRHG